MLYYDSNDISEGINVNKPGASKEYYVCAYCCFLNYSFNQSFNQVFVIGAMIY